MAEVLRAEAKTAGNSQRICKPRTYSAAPRPLGTGAAAPAIFGYFPSLESNPPEAGPENKNHQTTEEEVQVTERGSERSRANPKERLQYLAAGTAGAAAPQGAGYGAVTGRAAG